MYVNLCAETRPWCQRHPGHPRSRTRLTVQVPDEVALCPPVEISAPRQPRATRLSSWVSLEHGGQFHLIHRVRGPGAHDDFPDRHGCVRGLDRSLPIDLVNPTPLEVEIVQEDDPYCPGDPVATGQHGGLDRKWHGATGSWSGQPAPGPTSNGGSATASPAYRCETFYGGVRKTHADRPMKPPGRCRCPPYEPMRQ